MPRVQNASATKMHHQISVLEAIRLLQADGQFEYTNKKKTRGKGWGDVPMGKFTCRPYRLYYKEGKFITALGPVRWIRRNTFSGRLLFEMF